jgi:hypothetical protein
MERRTIMLELKAKFDCVGVFENRKGLSEDAKRAHYVFGTQADIVLGGVYLDKSFPFPAEGILITLEKGGKS